MSMDEQHIELIRDTIKQGFENTNQKIDGMSEALSRHVEKDEVYWKKIDDQEAQIRLVKGVGGSGLVVSAVAWLWQKFGH
jgi:hypothetical protein